MDLICQNPLGSVDPLHGTHGGRGTGPSPDQHCANVLTISCTNGSLSTQQCLSCSSVGGDLIRKMCVCVCARARTFAYNSKEV